MLFKRKIYDKLVEWKNASQGRKALLIEGARRVGKSTIAREFGQNEYSSFVLIDFNTASAAVINAFENHLNDLNTFFLILSTEYRVKLHRRDTLFIFDEIQRYPRARQALKYLVSDGRYDYIATGSLISIRENVADISVPSEERRIAMYPMDFEEFGWALGNESLTHYIRGCFEKLEPLERTLHDKAMLLFRQYMIVGGMPQSVAAYIDNNLDFAAADAEKRDILRLYRNDIMKISASYRTNVLAIYDQIPAFLSHAERRVILSQVAGGSSFPRYHDTFFWLADSMIINTCFNCADPNVGLSLNEDRTYVKCYMGDTGLLVSHAFSENEVSDGELYRELLLGKLSVNEGMIYENAVSQMLVAAGHKLFFYTRYNPDKHRTDIEIDFLISNLSRIRYKIVPIEVKSSAKYKTTSLDRFDELFKSRIGRSYVIHPRNVSVDGDIVRIPAYMTFCL